MSVDIDGLADQEHYEDYDILRIDGYDDCAVGLVSRCGQDPFIVYDAEKIIEKLMGDGMDRDGAQEYFDFNIAGAWMGMTTPGFIETETVN